jgi:hypothetical protein
MWATYYQWIISYQFVNLIGSVFAYKATVDEW